MRRNVNKMSQILKDSPPPAAVIADSLEHVMKHGGEHLRSITQDMPLWEILALDVILFLFSVVVFVGIVVVFALKKLAKGCLKEKKKSKRE